MSINEKLLERVQDAAPTSEIEKILDDGADINWVDFRGNSSLHYAAGAGFESIVDLLLKRGANVNLENNHKKTAINLAQINTHYSVVRKLIDSGAQSAPPKPMPPSKKQKTFHKSANKKSTKNNSEPISTKVPTHSEPTSINIRKDLNIEFKNIVHFDSILGQIEDSNAQNFVRQLVERIMTDKFRYFDDVVESKRYLKKVPHLHLYLAWGYSKSPDFKEDCIESVEQFLQIIQDNEEIKIDGRVFQLLLLLPYIKPQNRKFKSCFDKVYPNETFHMTSSTSLKMSKEDEIQKTWKHLKKELKGEKTDAMKELLSLTGLEEVKKIAMRMYSKALSDKKIPEVSRVPKRYNFSFMGNPGTGKTTVAKIYGRLLHEAGIRSSKKFKATSAQELLNLGSEDFEEMIDEAKGGVLFIDEAYALKPNINSTGKAIVDLILQKAEELRDSMTFILAGYKEDIENELYSYNIGMKSRFDDVSFEDFTKEQLTSIWTGLLNKYRWREEEGVSRIAINRIARGMGKKGFGNARDVRNMFEKATEEAQMRNIDPKNLELQITDIIGPEPKIENIPKLKNALKDLHNLTGLESVKRDIEKLIKTAQKNYNLELAGQNIIEIAKNCCFMGNPGTGKTTVAKIYGQVLGALRLLSKGDVESKTASDFKGQHVGQSQERTKNIIEMSQGKVLLIDEAYNLDDNLYGKQVLDTIVEKNTGSPTEDIAIVLCGYENEMKDMFDNQNPGLKRRFAHHIHFDDFSNEELLLILKRKSSSRQLQIKNDVAIEAIRKIAKKRAMPHFGNAGLIDNLLTEVQKKLSDRPNSVILLEDIYDEKEISKKNQDPFYPLRDLSGTESIIENLNPIYKSFSVYNRDGGRRPIVGNFIFTGNAGTGKTTIAQRMGEIFYNLGILAHDGVHVVTGKSLTGNVVGETKDKVNQAFQKASGGILFIDEAYDLGKGAYGEEALTTLLALLTDGRYNNDQTIVILAGYEHEISQMLSRNQGLIGRFSQKMVFDDWSTEQCFALLESKAQKDKFYFDENIKMKCVEDIEYLRDKLKGWANARDVITIYESALMQRNIRVFDTPEERPCLLVDDFKIVLQNKIQERLQFTQIVNSNTNKENDDFSKEIFATDQTSKQEMIFKSSIKQIEVKSETDEPTDIDADLRSDVDELNRRFKSLDQDLLGLNGKLGQSSLEGLLKKHRITTPEDIADFLDNRNQPKYQHIVETFKKTLLDAGHQPETIENIIETLLTKWREMQISSTKLIQKLKKKKIQIIKRCSYCQRPWGTAPGQCRYMGPEIIIIQGKIQNI